jgi:hypothetical protein
VPKVTIHSLYPGCIANLKLLIDAFNRESRSGVKIAKRNITTGLFGLKLIKLFFLSDFDPINYKSKNIISRTKLITLALH